MYYLKKKILPLQLVFMLLFFTFCNKSNSISFDTSTQKVFTTTNKGIYNLYIYNDDNKEEYRINWCNSEKSAPSEVYLEQINQFYCVYKGWERQKIEVEDIKLQPMSKYIIELAQGGATAFKITVLTDSTGCVYNQLP